MTVLYIIYNMQLMGFFCVRGIYSWWNEIYNTCVAKWTLCQMNNFDNVFVAAILLLLYTRVTRFLNNKTSYWFSAATYYIARAVSNGETFSQRKLKILKQNWITECNNNKLKSAFVRFDINFVPIIWLYSALFWKTYEYIWNLDIGLI